MHLDRPLSWRQRSRPQPVNQAQNFSEQSSGDSDFRSTLSSDQVEAEVARLERHIKAAFPEITRIFIEAEARTRGRGP